MDATLKDAIDSIVARLKRLEETEVRVALFGQPGAGKSSVINRLVGAPVAKVGAETDKTTEKAEYPRNGLILADLPGYGTTRFPKSGYLERFEIRSFDLFLCVFAGKFHSADTEFFSELMRIGKVSLFVRNKRDELWEDNCTLEDLERRICQDAAAQIGGTPKVFFTSCRTGEGFAALDQAILDHLTDAKRERWARNGKAYSTDFLNQKKAACEEIVVLRAALSAANALNPIPGADVAVDIAILQELFGELRRAYGLTDEVLKNSSAWGPAIAKISNRLLSYATKEGVPLLLKQFAKRETAKAVSKWIPLIGQVVAGLIGVGITMSGGFSYLDDCHDIAREVLERELQCQTTPAV